jgi:shikimate kinase
MTDLKLQPVFLIGYRGTWKSTIAPLLAERLGYDWIDADDELELRAGKSIAQIFADDGENKFRDLEVEIVAKLSKRSRTVVALGGGAILREANRAVIRTAGPVVWLTANVETLAARIAADKTTAARRPSLTKFAGRAEIEAVLAERTPIYRECATLVVDTEGKTPAQAADEIVASL